MSNPFLEPTTTYLYTLRPKRLAITSEGPTPEEAATVGRHWAHLQGLAAQGVILFAGRVLTTDETCQAHVIFRADTADAAQAVMENDPAVREGLMTAQLFPYQTLLMGTSSHA